MGLHVDCYCYQCRTSDASSELTQARATIETLRDILKRVCGEATQSVEFGDWPELQDLIDEADKALAEIE